MAKDEVLEFFTSTIEEALKKSLEQANTEEDAQKIIDKFDKLDIQDMFIELINNMSKDSLDYMKKNMYEEVLQFRSYEQEFLARQEQKWFRAFVASEALYIMVTQTAEHYKDFVSELDKEKTEKKQWTYTALLHIHGRAMQQYLEIVTLIKNGFADGAYARWRSMYELAIICSFIEQHGENVAKAFVEASNTDDRYEWARVSGLFTNKKKYITFSDIQKNCDIDSPIWREQYDLANKTVHASSQCTFNRLCTMGDKRVISIGRSDYGITTPAEHSAISLVQISAMYFNVFTCAQTLVSLKGINQWINVIREIYFKAHDEIFPDDEPMWEDGMLDKSVEK